MRAPERGFRIGAAQLIEKRELHTAVVTHALSEGTFGHDAARVNNRAREETHRDDPFETECVDVA